MGRAMAGPVAFGPLLRIAMRYRGVTGSALAKRRGKSIGTVSRWLNGKITPPTAERRGIERDLRIESGFLDRPTVPGDAELDRILGPLTPEPPRPIVVKEPLVPYRPSWADEVEDGPPEGPGWLWGDPTEAESQFLSFLRNIERTTRAMVGNPDLFSAEETRINQLAVCRAAMKSHELAGEPVPEWLHRIYNELISGSFR